MKVLFTADLHINLRQKNVPKTWSLKRYQIMFEELTRIYKENNCDLIVFGGDIFDKAPTLEELGLFLSYIWKNENNQTVYIYDGNHEATRRGSTFFEYIKAIVPVNCIIVDRTINIGNMRIIPYCNLYSAEQAWLEQESLDGCDILLTHVRGEIPPHVKPEVNLDMFDNFDIVFAGDLHSHSNSQKNIVYPGSPTTVTFHRNPVKTGVIVFDTKHYKDWKWEEVKVPQLIRLTVDDPNKMIKTSYDHTIYELKGDMLDLAKIKDIDILDKKIIEHKSEATLNLKNLSMNEEIEVYCSKILKLPNEKITKLLKVYNDNTQEIDME